MDISDHNVIKFKYYQTALGVVAAMLHTPVAAQSDTGTASATIIEEVEFAVELDLDFGQITTNNVGGIVELSPSTGIRDCSSALTCTGLYSMSRLSLSGSDALVRINYQRDFELIGPGDPMRVEPSLLGGSGAVVALTGGSAIFDFGAKLFVNPNQASGQYSGTFTVNVEYE